MTVEALPKLKPVVCKHCHAILGYCSERVFKSGKFEAVIEQGRIIIRCETCGLVRNWKPCDTLL